MTDTFYGDHPFIQTFQSAWASPTLDGLMAPLSDEVTLIQPLSKPIIGKRAAREAFRKLLYRFPGLRGEIAGGLSAGDRLMIQWTMIGG